jgi:hypothetical protein
MSAVVTATRSMPGSGSLVLRVAQTVRLRDVVSAARLPGLLRRLAALLFGRSWDRGLFASMGDLGFSVRATEPLRSLTLARPLGRAGSGSWASGAPHNAVLVQLAISPVEAGTEVSVSLGVDRSRTLRGLAVRALLWVLRPLLAWGLRAWLAGLADRLDQPR